MHTDVVAGIVLFLPGSQHFAAGGEIELAYHRIPPTAAELRDTEQQGDGKAEYGVRFWSIFQM